MENGHYVHYYEIEYEDGTRDIKPGLFAYAYQDEDGPCINCGNTPRKKVRKLCEECINRGI